MSILLSSKPRSRLVVLGLDGMPLDLALQLGASLPNIRRLAQHATTVKAELPELSPVNWTAFFTGEGPEKHGIFGFSHLDPQTYQMRITNSLDVTCPTIFDRLGTHGILSRIINLPGTYPVRQLRGMCISGFVSLDIEKAVYPSFLKEKLCSINYKLEADTNRGQQDLDYLLAELRATLHSRLNALDMLWPDLGWDLFIHVFTETDRLFHFFMDAVLHTDHPSHLKCLRFLADWDHAIGLFLKRYDALPGPKRLLVLADHGFTELKTEVCLNTWLKQQGFLTLSGTPDDEWDASKLSSESQAFALDPGRIYIHSATRFGRGRVSEQNIPALINTIRHGLLQLTYKGSPVLKAVHTRDTLYPGAHTNQVPDLICEAHPGFDLKAKFDRTDIFGLHGRTGTHTVEGALFYDTEDSQPRSLRDIGTTILQHFDIKK
ncbi:phosphodiesterase [Pseudodesulfovibrio sp. JC047]|uniref:alkaline phosphatase family protein n=1 Tax=Pseudodesulfovibrio sp. JC047 TaxID=2683199 RepID=UPI0013D04C7E|nr:alkaline phosphatase family protein [Pseudodesulfovibrio sp. JC047]NDV19804.1 phosphodiesterase [Pseudodesulfovibrio sp. JC047]